VQCVELARWNEMSRLVSGLFESSAFGSQLAQLRSCSDSQQGLEAVNTEVKVSTALEAIIRRRVVKTQQTEKT
jgi:hypothetical protein